MISSKTEIYEKNVRRLSTIHSCINNRKKDAFYNIILNCFKWSSIIFVAFNILARFTTLYYYNFFIKVLFIGLTICCIAIFFFPAYNKFLLLLFGFSFFLFGFRPYDIESQVFEVIVAFIALTISMVNLKTRSPISTNKHMLILLACYIGLSMSSLLLFPKTYLLETIYLFGLKNSLWQIFNAMPNSYFYSFAGLNRILLFFILSFQLSSLKNNRECYKFLFVGLFSGAVFSCIIGMLDYYNVISLAWYRHNSTLTGYVLHSTFLNRGWFAEFIVITVPFVLIGFISQNKSRCINFMLFGLLIICEIALILSGSRSGWVSYPIVLIICWSFFYYHKKDNSSITKLTPKDYIKIIVSVPVTIVISVIFVFQIAIPLSQSLDKSLKNANKTKDAEHYLVRQTSRLFEPSGRYKVWNHAYNIGRESPLWGLGYESFSLHGNILSKISTSYYSQNTTGYVHDTPHNTFLQLYVSGGIIGLSIWLIIVCYTVMILSIDLIKYKNYLNAAVIISIISFHIMGVFQSMQYIPMIWLCIFMYYGYAMTISEKILSPRHTTKWDRIAALVAFIVGLSIIVYYQNPFSETLKNKYNLNAYALNHDQEKYLGFYALEKWPNGNFRWSGRRAAMKVKATSNFFKMRVNAHAPNSDGSDGLELKLLLNGNRLDKVHFFNGGMKELCYYIPTILDKKIEITTEVSRTFNPYRLGLSRDNRDLGVAVSPIRFIEKIPEKGIGFYKMETYSGEQQPIFLHGQPLNFRWTGMRASMEIPCELKNGGTLLLMCAHPNIDKEPVVVKILGDDMVIWNETFTNSLWKKVILQSDKIKDLRVLTFQVNRTWNPKLTCVSGDSRDLGVAVAILKSGIKEVVF